MYILIVYDVSVKRVSKVHKFLKGYLHWRQNSVFEGELTKSQIETVRSGLKDIIDDETDNILFYIARDEKWLKREMLGKEKNTTDNLL
jgi:CRISPR-associated protein Cas2